jgi:fusion protein PurCD
MSRPCVLIIGSGGREYAIAKTLKESRENPIIYCFENNVNSLMSNVVDYIIHDHYHLGLDQRLEEHFLCTECGTIKNKHTYSFVFIGSENVLNYKIQDHLYKNNINVVGPTSDLLKLESSKAFTRNFIESSKKLYNANPYYLLFEPGEVKNALSEIKEKLGNNYVLKSNGLKSGKGVSVYGEHIKDNTALQKYLQSFPNDETLLVEEKLVGREFSLMAFVNRTFIHWMPIVQDFKRRNNHDTGPNTGGMGSITSQKLIDELGQNTIENAKKIMQDTLLELNSSNYHGILYGQFMKLTKNSQVKLIEYNCRFGDPEAINISALLDQENGDSLYKILLETSKQNSTEFNSLNIQWKNKESCCIYLVPKNYATSTKNTSKLPFYLNKNTPHNISIIFADTIKEKDSEYFTTNKVKCVFL